MCVSLPRPLSLEQPHLRGRYLEGVGTLSVTGSEARHTGPLALDVCCHVNRLLGCVGLQRTEARVAPASWGGDGDTGAQVTPPAAVPLAYSSRKGQRFLVVPESPLPAHLSARPTCQGRAGERGAHEHGPDLQGRSAGVRGLRPEQVATQAAEWKAYGCRSHPWSPTGLRVPVKSQDARR